MRIKEFKFVVALAEVDWYVVGLSILRVFQFKRASRFLLMNKIEFRDSKLLIYWTCSFFFLRRDELVFQHCFILLKQFANFNILAGDLSDSV